MTRTTNCVGHEIQAHFGPVDGWLAISEVYETRALALEIMEQLRPNGYELRVYEALKIKT